MDGSWLCMSCSNLGIVTEEKQRSEKDRLLRNKYMGVWRWGSRQMRTRMRRFPQDGGNIHGQEQGVEQVLML